MSFDSESARKAQLKSAENARLTRLDLAKQSRRVIAKALLAGDTRVAMQVAIELGVLRQERRAQSDSTLSEAINMLSQVVPVPGPTQAAAKGGADANAVTDSHKIFAESNQVIDSNDDDEQDT